MTIQELQQQLEKLTDYTFTQGKDCLERDVLYLDGLVKRREISVGFGESFKFSVNGSDKVKSENNSCGYRGFGYPCNTISEVIKAIDRNAKDYGHTITAKQLSLF